MARKDSKNFLHRSDAKGLCSLCSRGNDWVGKYSRTYTHHIQRLRLLIEKREIHID